jgi:HK97 gp10 family phage protein
MKEFDSFLEFATFLGEVIVKEVEAEHMALEKAAQVIEKRAKEKVGEYQSQIGQFVAWAELADSTKDDRLRLGYSENDPGLRSGAMRDSVEHHVEGGEANIGSNDDHLVYFELGTSKQPPRSVLGGAAAEKSNEVAEIIGEAVTLALIGDQVHQKRLPIP